MSLTTTANVLVTDVVGSTVLLTTLGAEAGERLRLLHDRIVCNVVEVFDGELVKSTGDGSLALLPSADRAVRCAAAIGEAALWHDVGLRVGVATGDVVRTVHDCHGEAPVMASRLCALADRGQVLVSATTHAVRGGRHHPALVSIGERRLKGFDAAQQVFAVAPAGDSAPQSWPSRSSSARTLVGRHAEISAVEAIWSGSGVLAVLRGEPGIGKTQVARALADRWRGEVVSIRFEPSSAEGFVRCCRSLDEWTQGIPAGVLAALGRDRAGRLAALLPSVGERLGLAVTPTVGEGDRERSFEALSDVVTSARGGVLLVLDDVQWAGPTALAFVQWLVERSAGPVRLLTTCRPPMPVELDRMGAPVVDLGGMSDDELLALLLDRDADVNAARVGIAQARGNPFLAIVSSELAQGPTHGPARVDPVAARFLNLEPAVVEVLATAAVVGRVVDLSLLEQLVDYDGADVAQALDVGLAVGVLHVRDGHLCFTHDLVLEAAAARIAAHRRAVLHARIADAHRHRGDVLKETSHLSAGFAALDPLEGVTRVNSACAEMTERGMFEDAYKTACELVDLVRADGRGGPRADTLAILSALDASHLYPADTGETARLTALAADAARAANDPELLGRVAVLGAETGTVGRPDPQAMGLLDEAIDRLGSTSPTLTSRLLATRAFYLATIGGQADRALPMARAAIELARTSGDPITLAEVLTSVGYGLIAGPDIAWQSAVIAEATALVPQLPPRVAARVATSCDRIAATLALQRGDRREFDRRQAAVASWCDRWNRVVLTNVGILWRGLTALLDGRPHDAEAHVRPLLSLGSGYLNFVRGAIVLGASSRRWRGSIDGLSDDFASVADAEPGLPLARSHAAICAALEGDMKAARRHVELLRQSLNLLIDDTTHAAQLAALVEACALTGTHIPDTVVTTLHSYVGQILILSYGVDVAGAADRFLAVCFVTRGNGTLAATHFDRAEALEHDLSEPHRLRTRVWRHTLLGDVDMPNVPSQLAGLAHEKVALQHTTKR